MPLINETEAVTRLQAHLPALRDIVVGGWNDYRQEYSDKQRTIHTATTRAGIVHDHQIERASRYCQIAADARLDDLTRLKLLVLDGVFAIRFKKLDDDMRSANLPTQQITDFRAQEQLPGLPETHNLEAGYVLPKIGAEVSDAYLVCPNGPKTYWVTALTGAAANQKVFELHELQREQERQDTETVGVVVRAKKSNIILPFRREGDES